MQTCKPCRPIYYSAALHTVKHVKPIYKEKGLHSRQVCIAGTPGQNRPHPLETQPT